MTLRTYADRHPIAAAILCAGLQFCLTLLILSLGKQFAPAEAYGKVKLLAFASTVILPLLLTHLLGVWRQVGFNRIRPTGFFVACLLPVLMFASMGVRLPAAGALGGDLLIQFFNAFGEELLFRGVIFVLLMRLPLWQAIALNGVLFGSMHLIHGYMDGNWSHALVWALMSSCAGMMFAAAYASSGSLWLLIGLHMILNLASMYSNIGVVAGEQVLHRAEWAIKAVELALARCTSWAPPHVAARWHGRRPDPPAICLSLRLQRTARHRERSAEAHALAGPPWLRWASRRVDWR